MQANFFVSMPQISRIYTKKKIFNGAPPSLFARLWVADAG